MNPKNKARIKNALLWFINGKPVEVEQLSNDVCDQCKGQLIKVQYCERCQIAYDE